MTGDSTIRKLTDATALLVAVIAAVVSFVHIENLAVTHGQTHLAAWLLPVSVDGMVAAASLSMLWAARSGLATPWLARCMLTLGVLATLGANVGYGAPDGLSRELLSGWPAVAFVGSVEMVLAMVRRARTAPELPAVVAHVAPADSAQVTHDAIQAALRATVTAGNPLSGRQLAERFGLNRRAGCDGAQHSAR